MDQRHGGERVEIGGRRQRGRNRKGKREDQRYRWERYKEEGEIKEKATGRHRGEDTERKTEGRKDIKRRDIGREDI